MAVHYIVHRYLSDCGLSHEPIGAAYRLELPYDRIKDLSAYPVFTKIALEHHNLEDFRVLIDHLVLNTRDIRDRILQVIVYAMLYARILTLLKKPELIPEVISIVHRVDPSLPLSRVRTPLFRVRKN